MPQFPCPVGDGTRACVFQICPAFSARAQLHWPDNCYGLVFLSVCFALPWTLVIAWNQFPNNLLAVNLESQGLFPEWPDLTYFGEINQLLALRIYIVTTFFFSKKAWPTFSVKSILNHLNWDKHFWIRQVRIGLSQWCGQESWDFRDVTYLSPCCTKGSFAAPSQCVSLSVVQSTRTVLRDSTWVYTENTVGSRVLVACLGPTWEGLFSLLLPYPPAQLLSQHLCVFAEYMDEICHLLCGLEFLCLGTWSNSFYLLIFINQPHISVGTR